ncbi:hypothetical protein [Hymenobacter sp. BRD67]|uniref:hypothetical protein n=1 Tax=Hymenobacter sp. BRD67 TaxID=2675877 RepID=UPI00156388C6|nr:hypothetical protein [Hymenobacter sp. BRD67]QKG53979.1 hypothetical protein GKZ67_16935 [Hymenobacter sp. BRD67]
MVVYAGLFAWYSWPLSREVSTAFVGYANGDANQYIWNVWNFRRQVVAGHSPMFTPLLLYPQGTSLWLHTYTQVLGVLNLVLNQEFWSVNLGLLLSFVLSGVGAARLAGRWVRQPLLCALVGFAFAFSPYKLARWPEHYNLLLTATVPFYLSAFLDAFAFKAGRLWPRIRSRRALAWVIILLIVSFFSDYYVLAGLCYFSAGYAAWWGLRLGAIRWRRWQPWAWLAAIFVLGHFVSRGLGLLGLDDRGGIWWGGDLAGYLVPPVGSRWLATAATDAFWHSPRFHSPASVENISFLGYILPLAALFLAVAALRSRRLGSPPAAPATPAETRPFWALLLLFVLLTMPELRWMGHDLFRLPTGIVHFVPFFNNIRCPVRHVMMASLLLPLAVSIGLDKWLLGRARGWRLGLPALLLAGVFGEYQHTAYPLIRTADVPEAYRLAAALPGGILFPVPLGLRDGNQQVGIMNPAELFYQTRHAKALRGGYLSRVPAATFAAFAHEPVLRTLLIAEQHPDSLALLPAPTPAELLAFRQRYPQAIFVIRPEQHEQPAHRLLRQWLLPAGYTEQLVAGYEGDYSLLKPPLPAGY